MRTFTLQIKFGLSQVMYGGRAIDDFDRRILRTYMDEYMGDFIFDSFQPFHFYHDDTVDYFIPQPEVPSVKDEYLGWVLVCMCDSLFFFFF